MVPGQPAWMTMTTRTYLDEDMSGPEVVKLVGAEVCILSRRSPDKESENQDAAAIIEVGPQSAVLVVADGMGGARGGASASRIAIEELTRVLTTPSADSRRESILCALDTANQRVIDLGVGAGTTLGMTEVETTSFPPYHIGDAGLVLVGGQGKIKKLTLSHAPVAYAVESGLLDEAEAMHHDDRHLVTNNVGHADMRVEMGTPTSMRARDSLVLATDGLFDNLHIEEIAEIVRRGPIEACVLELMTRCRERQLKGDGDLPSKPDDTTIIVYRRSRTPVAAG